MGIEMQNTVTVITSTIGRPELRQCALSVQQQIVPCRHMIFANGEKYWVDAERSLFHHSCATAEKFFLREETGYYGLGTGSSADVYSAAPFLTNSEWVLFLDDDNWIEPNHVESLLTLVKKHDLKWAYSLRRFVAPDGSVICDDDWDSLGHHNGILVDQSCYFVHRSLAKRFANAWSVKGDVPGFGELIIGDRAFFACLKDSGARGGCTGLVTVNYRVGATLPADPAGYLEMSETVRAKYPQGLPWKEERVYNPRNKEAKNGEENHEKS
jgi:hypothetical protein